MRGPTSADPAYARDDARGPRYGVRLYGVDVLWTVDTDVIWVLAVRIDP